MSARALSLLVSLLAGAAHADLRATCEPAEVVRGEDVRCSVSTSPPAAFVLTERRASGVGHERTETLHEPHAPDETAHWDGPAAVATEVRFTARLLDGPSQAATARFTVIPRRFPRVLLAPDDFHCQLDPSGRMLGRNLKTSSDAGQVLNDREVTHARLDLPSPEWSLVDHGPDADWYFVSKPVAEAPSLRIWLATDFEPGGALLRAQHSDRSLPPASEIDLPHCRKTDLIALRKHIREAEGCDPGDHGSRFRRVQRLLAGSLDVNGVIEGLTEPLDPAATKNSFVARLSARLREAGDAALLDPAARPPAVELRCQLREASAR